MNLSCILSLIGIDLLIKLIVAYLTRVMETMLYFTLPAEDFACTPLRTFLATLVANVVLKPVVDMLSDPDFLNLQLARLVSKEPPPSEYFIKMVRQSSDLSELRACRQLITREMDKVSNLLLCH